jgi:hypothetical protein
VSGLAPRRLGLIRRRTAKQGRAYQLTLCEAAIEALVALPIVVLLALVRAGMRVLVHGTPLAAPAAPRDALSNVLWTEITQAVASWA